VRQEVRALRARKRVAHAYVSREGLQPLCYACSCVVSRCTVGGLLPAAQMEETLKDRLDRAGDDEAAEAVAAFEVKYNRLKERYKVRCGSGHAAQLYATCIAVCGHTPPNTAQRVPRPLREVRLSAVQMLEDSSQEELDELQDQLSEAQDKVAELQRQIKQLQAQTAQ
jgi:hypothetical protein